MFERLTRQACAEQLRSKFQLQASTTQTFELELIEVAEINRRVGQSLASGQKESFSLLFLGPKDPSLPQRIYPMKHADLGSFEIFLVPVGRDDRGTRYEAIFNFAVTS